MGSAGGAGAAGARARAGAGAGAGAGALARGCVCQGTSLATVRLPYAFGTKTYLPPCQGIRAGLGLGFLVVVAVALVLGRR